MLAHDDQGSGPVVVLLHGHPFERSMWRPQLEALAGRFRVIAPDLRGYGASTATPGTVTMRELAGDVEALLADLGVGRAAVVGLSMGGLVAMELVLADPERWWALGLVATTAEPITEDERRARLEMADTIEREGMGPQADAMGPRLFGPHCPPEVVEEIERMMRAGDPAGAAAALRGRARRPDYRPGLRQLDVPAFVCTGTADAYSTAEVTRNLVACLREPRVLSLPDVGHLPNLERPGEVDRALGDFLAGAAPPAG